MTLGPALTVYSGLRARSLAGERTARRPQTAANRQRRPTTRHRPTLCKPPKPSAQRFPVPRPPTRPSTRSRYAQAACGGGGLRPCCAAAVRPELPLCCCAAGPAPHDDAHRDGRGRHFPVLGLNESFSICSYSSFNPCILRMLDEQEKANPGAR